MKLVDILRSKGPHLTLHGHRLDASLPNGSDEGFGGQAGASHGVRGAEETAGYDLLATGGTAPCPDHVGLVHAPDELADGAGRQPEPMGFDNGVIPYTPRDVLARPGGLVRALGLNEALLGLFDSSRISWTHVCQCDMGFTARQGCVRGKSVETVRDAA